MFIEKYKNKKPYNDILKTKKMLKLEMKFGEDIYTLIVNNINCYGITGAANELGIHRKTLREYIKKLNIDTSFIKPFPSVKELYKSKYRPYTRDTLLMIKDELRKGTDFEQIAFIIKRNPYQIQELIEIVKKTKGLRTYTDTVRNKNYQYYYEIS